MNKLLEMLLCAAAMCPLTATAEDVYTTDGAAHDAYTDGSAAEADDADCPYLLPRARCVWHEVSLSRGE